jgi:hypothetical protein
MASTVQKVNFEPVSDILTLWLRDLPLANPDLADPLNAVAIVDGEWLTLDTNYKWVRATDITNASSIASVKSFPCFSERGRSDRMGMSQKKTDAIFRGEYEFDTRIYDSAVGTAITFVMQPLKVRTITIGTRNYTGLVGHNGSGDTDPVVGYVTKLPANNGGKLRFISGYRV